MRHVLLKKVEKFIENEKLLAPGDVVIAGVSGGADSVCLFEVLKELRERYSLTIKVVCVDHGLRAEAKEEIRYVRELCEKADVEFVVRTADVTGYAAQNGLGDEEAGRILRYKIFEDIATATGENAKIAVAHNMNDVSETFLFNLFRGTGPRGLGSLKPARGNIIRPLLCLERAEIEDFLLERDIKYCTDSSNLSDDYSRNKIRHHILGYAADNINEAAISHVAATADYIRELNDIVEDIAKKSLSSDIILQKENEVIVKRSTFADENGFLAGTKAKMCIDMLVPNNKDITSTHLGAIKDIADKEGTHKCDLPYDIHVTATADCVRFLRGKEQTSDEQFVISGEKGCISVEGLGTVKWEVSKRCEGFAISQKQYTKSFDYDKITQCLVLRKPAVADYLTINEKFQKKKLSDYFTNEKVPVFQREEKFVLADGSHIWWVTGMRISEYPKVTDYTGNILTVTIYKEDNDGEASC